MSKYKAMKCGHCKKEVEPQPDPDFDGIYQPTSSDPDYLESSYPFVCPHCGGNLSIRWRYWLENGSWRVGNKIEAMDVSTDAPDDHPWLSAFEMVFSPSGEKLYIYTFDHNWILEKKDSRWVGGSEYRKLPMTWYADQSKYIWYVTDSFGMDWRAKIFDAETNEEIEEIKYSDDEYLMIGQVSGGQLLSDRFLAICREEGYKDPSWLNVYDIKKKNWKEKKLPYKNLSASNYKSWFEPGGHRLLRGYGETYSIYHTELYTIDPSSPSLFAEGKLFKEQYFEILHALWLENGSILLLYLANKTGLYDYDDLPIGLLWLDGKDLTEIKRITRFPSEVCQRAYENDRGERVEKGDIEVTDFFPWPGQPDRYLLVTDTLYEVEVRGEEIISHSPLNPGLFPPVVREWYEHYKVTLEPGQGILAVSYRGEIILYDLNKKRVITRGSEHIPQ